MVSVGGADAIKVRYDNDDTDTMTEESLLKVFEVMKKEILRGLRKRRDRDCANPRTKRSRRR